MIQVARYLNTLDPLPDAGLSGFDYITAGNGLFKRARNRHCEALIPLAPAHVAGLPELEPYIILTGNKLPGRLLHVALQDARRLALRAPREAMYHLVIASGEARLVRPPQSATDKRLGYLGGGDPAIVCDLHSHCEMHASFSQTDDRDEVGFRFYATMGRIFTRPEIVFRLGIYGDFCDLPITALFTDPGPFREGAFPYAPKGDQWTHSTSSRVTASRSGVLSVRWS